MSNRKDVLTTGQVAKICKVAPRTVSKWFDAGQLRGYRIPGSKDRRIPMHHLIRFMKVHGIPLNGLQSGETRVLILDDTDNEAMLELLTDALGREAGYEVQSAHSAFEAGVLAEKLKPNVLMVDVTLSDVAVGHLCRLIREQPELADIRLIAVSGALTEGLEQRLLDEGFDACLRKPFDIRKVIETVESVLAVPV
jgi:excisionase family DNA binding protein